MKYTITLIALSFGLCLFAQEDFENWEADTILTLEGFTTSSDEWYYFGKDLVKQVAPYQGNHAIRVETQEVNGDTLLGFFTNGDPGDLSGGVDVNLTSVDSLVGYFRYDIQPGDSGTVICTTKSGGFPTTANGLHLITGTQSTWKRMAFYIGAPSVDSVLLAVASSNAMVGFGIAGSFIEVDQLSLKQGTTEELIYNADFESWPEKYKMHPVGWETSILFVEDSTIASQTPIAYSGNSAIALKNVFYDNDSVGGIATNGVFDLDNSNGSFVAGGTPFASNPTHIEWYYDYSPAGQDSAWGQIQFKKNGALIAIHGGIMHETTGYTHFIQPINLPVTPDTLLMTFAAGENINSVLLIDAIDFIFPLGINDWSEIQKIEAYPNPVSDVLRIRYSVIESGSCRLELIDGLGRPVFAEDQGFVTENSQKNTEIDVRNLEAGNYYVRLIQGNNNVVYPISIKK